MGSASPSRKMVQQYVTVKKGGPFQIVRTPYPTPGADEVCIRNRAIGLNPLDCKSLAHGMMVESWPAVLGIACAGVVEAVGESVTIVKPGDAVLCLAGFDTKAGAFQDITTVPESYVARKPKDWNFNEAASVP